MRFCCDIPLELGAQVPLLDGDQLLVFKVLPKLRLLLFLASHAASETFLL
jgi:hypothetical protein